MAKKRFFPLYFLILPILVLPYTLVPNAWGQGVLEFLWKYLPAFGSPPSATCQKLKPYEGMVFESLTHSTSLKNLSKILAAGKLQPLKSLVGVKGSIPQANPRVVYAQLSPRWMIIPQISENPEVPEEAILELPLALLEQKSDWHLSNYWECGFYYKEGSAYPHEKEKIRALLYPKHKDLQDKFQSLQEQCGPLGISREIQQDRNQLPLFSMMQNEVVFYSSIDLEQIDFKIHFSSVKLMEKFLASNPSLFHGRAVSKGQSPLGFPILELKNQK